MNESLEEDIRILNYIQGFQLILHLDGKTFATVLTIQLSSNRDQSISRLAPKNTVNMKSD